MDKDDFIKRLTELRMAKGISARDMSLSIGMSHSYMARLENGVGLPTMENFFYICDFLDISPRDFFDYADDHTSMLSQILTAALSLTPKQQEAILTTIKAMKD